MITPLIKFKKILLSIIVGCCILSGCDSNSNNTSQDSSKASSASQASPKNNVSSSLYLSDLSKGKNAHQILQLMFNLQAPTMNEYLIQEHKLEHDFFINIDEGNTSREVNELYSLVEDIQTKGYQKDDYDAASATMLVFYSMINLYMQERYKELKVDPKNPNLPIEKIRQLYYEGFTEPKVLESTFFYLDKIVIKKIDQNELTLSIARRLPTLFANYIKNDLLCMTAECLDDKIVLIATRVYLGLTNYMAYADVLAPPDEDFINSFTYRALQAFLDQYYEQKSILENN